MAACTHPRTATACTGAHQCSAPSATHTTLASPRGACPCCAHQFTNKHYTKYPPTHFGPPKRLSTGRPRVPAAVLACHLSACSVTGERVARAGDSHHNASKGTAHTAVITGDCSGGMPADDRRSAAANEIQKLENFFKKNSLAKFSCYGLQRCFRVGDQVQVPATGPA